MKKSRSYLWKVIGFALITFGVSTAFLTGFRSAYTMVYLSFALAGFYLYLTSFEWEKFEQHRITMQVVQKRSLFRSLELLVIAALFGHVQKMINTGGEFNYTLIIGALASVVVASILFAYTNKDDEVQPIPTAPSRPAYLNKDHRRYTMMVESVIEEENVTVSGVLHGEIHVGDDVAILHPQRETVYAKVLMINDDAENTSAKSDSVRLMLDVQKIPAFSVISSYEPSEVTHATHENPLLVGMTYEYGRYRGNKDYMSLYIYTLVHSKFIVPVKMDHKPMLFNGKAQFMQDTKIGFMSVNRTTGDQTIRTFALFSDRSALSMWKDLHKNGNNPSTLTITFQDAVSIMWKGHQGIVLNPFGPVYVYLSAEMIDMITKQDSYRDEFGVPGEHGLSFDHNRRDS